MRFGITPVLAGVGLLVAGLASSTARAVPVEVDLTSLRAIQTFSLDKKAPDTAYVMVTGVAKGQPVNERFPKDKTWEAGPKKPAVSAKEPAALWKGDLGDGEFAVLTVVLFQGKGEDAGKAKEFVEMVSAAGKGVAALSKKTLTADEIKAASADLLKAQRDVVAKVKDTLSREKNTDHFGGLFNVVVRNDGGKIAKRLDPVGLTFGEHFGTEVKVYTKLKITRGNVFVQNDNGEWSEQSLPALSDDNLTVRVKMLETEYVQTPERKVRNTTDYLADVQVKAAGQPEKWKLGGEQPGEDEIHLYWLFAD